MTVKELIQALKKMPQGAKVFHLWDGGLRTEVNIVYESRSGDVVTSDYDEVCYSTDDRPKYAPTSEEDRHWCTPSDPNE